MKAEVGMVVRIHPAHDLFMRGVVHATVVKVGRDRVHVQAHRNNHTYRLHPENLLGPDGVVLDRLDFETPEVALERARRRWRRLAEKGYGPASRRITPSEMQRIDNTIRNAKARYERLLALSKKPVASGAVRGENILAPLGRAADERSEE